VQNSELIVIKGAACFLVASVLAAHVVLRLRNTPSPRALPRQTFRSASRKRLLTAAAVITSLLAATTLYAGVTSARLSAVRASGSTTFTAGTVKVGLGSGTSVQCAVTNLAPGEGSTGYSPGAGATTQCSYFVTYTGSEAAYLALDVAITNGTTKLYDSNATGLQLLIKDNAATPTTYVGSSAGAGGTKYRAQGSASLATTLASPGTASNLLVSTSSFTAATFTTAFGANGLKFTVDYALPIPSSNSNIGGSSTITLTFHAVQASNNTLPAACTAAGMACTSQVWS
jgi:hypothetical protein